MLDKISRLNSPFTVRFYGLCLEPKLCMIIEYCARDSLYKNMNGDMYFTWELFFKFFSDMCQGIDVMHSQDPPVVHRDLKRYFCTYWRKGICCSFLFLSMNLLLTQNWELKVSGNLFCFVAFLNFLFPEIFKILDWQDLRKDQIWNL